MWRPTGSVWTSRRATSTSSPSRARAATSSPTRSPSRTRATCRRGCCTRHWLITDANGKVQEVRGDGVVGEQPYLKPGQGFRYSSGAVIETPVGAMQGSYQMLSDDGQRFDASIRALPAGDAGCPAVTGPWRATPSATCKAVTHELRALLARLNFSADRDQLWFVGDLVNRGPQSLEVLRFVRALGDNAIVVLGNHDLHLLALAHASAESAARATRSMRYLKRPTAMPFSNGCCDRPLAHLDAAHGDLLVHAGVVPQWTAAQTIELAAAKSAPRSCASRADSSSACTATGRIAGARSCAAWSACASRSMR